MADCKQTLEISIPETEVDTETERVVAKLRDKVRIPGFRPGKVPADLIRKRFDSDIRQEVLETLVPKHFRKRVEDENLKVVGTPDITDVHFHKGEPLRFKAEFEVAPEIELQEYRELEVSYKEPAVTDEDVEKRIEEIRDQKAEYINVEPRPVADGDYAVVSLESVGGVEGPPIKQDELVLHIGDPETLAAFSDNLRGLTPGAEAEFDVTYPEEYTEKRLAGKTAQFRTNLKAIRRKELPELNDEFAHDLGDFQTLEEVKETVRKSIFRDREMSAQQEAKEKLVDKLVELHGFPVPETFIDRQIEVQTEQNLRGLAAQGVDIKQLKLDWEHIKSSQRDRAQRDVKASLILDRIAEREAMDATMDEVDRELQRFAKQQREPVAAVRMRFEKDGTLRRIANRIRTEKVLNFLFENARKTAE